MKRSTAAFILIALAGCSTMELEEANLTLSRYAMDATAEKLRIQIRHGARIIRDEDRCAILKGIDIYEEAALHVERISEALEEQKEGVSTDSLYHRFQVHFAALDSCVSRNRIWLGMGINQLTDFRAKSPKDPFYYNQTAPTTRLIDFLDATEKYCNRALSTTWPINRGCFFIPGLPPRLHLKQHAHRDSVYLTAYFEESICTPESATFSICGRTVPVDLYHAEVACPKRLFARGPVAWETIRLNTNTGQTLSDEGTWTSVVSWW